ncbi:MAG: hypothetical protein KAQ69_03180 [Spirochaetales bacterium]|nr:hypothetical protein [Spirochaetales bacterium]
MKVLITSGGTEEPLDGVRYITNFSTGRTGAGLAAYLAAKGSDVVLLHGYHAVLPRTATPGTTYGDITLIPYRTFSDLDKRLQDILKNDQTIDTVIHLAAVSDYSPESIETPDGKSVPAGVQGKLSSESETMIVRLRRNHKILKRIREYACGGGIILVGFKLTNTTDPDEQNQAVQALLHSGICDLLVHNDLGEIGAGAEDFHHAASIYDADGNLLSHTKTKQQLFQQLYTHICQLKRRLHP